MIYDDAGYIAGVQSVLLESDVDMAYNDLTKQVGDEFLNTIYLNYSLRRTNIKHRKNCKYCLQLQWPHQADKITLYVVKN